MKKLTITSLLCLSASFLFSQNIDSSLFYYKKGIEAKDARLFAVAGKNFDKAIQFNQNYAEAYIENGKVNLEMRKVDAAMGNFTKAYQLQPGNNEVVKQLSTLYFNNHQFQKAIDITLKCSSCPDADRIMGMSYYNLEDYGKAVILLQKAIGKNDKDAESAYTLGRTYLELENEKNAIPQFQRAIALEPDRNAWMYELGLIYYSQEDYKNALKYLNMAGAAGYSKTNDFYENVGFAQLYTGDTQTGMKTLTEIILRKPNNTELLNNIAQAMYDTKHYNEAENYYEKLLTINPKDARSLFMAGMTFLKMGNKQMGQKLCDKAIEMDPALANHRQKQELPM
jgi:tetratricopeptide (TPR) repeat protein